MNPMGFMRCGCAHTRPPARRSSSEFSKIDVKSSSAKSGSPLSSISVSGGAVLLLDYRVLRTKANSSVTWFSAPRVRYRPSFNSLIAASTQEEHKWRPAAECGSNSWSIRQHGGRQDVRKEANLKCKVGKPRILRDAKKYVRQAQPKAVIPSKSYGTQMSNAPVRNPWRKVLQNLFHWNSSWCPNWTKYCYMCLHSKNQSSKINTPAMKVTSYPPASKNKLRGGPRRQ